MSRLPAAKTQKERGNFDPTESRQVDGFSLFAPWLSDEGQDAV
jgi:hypothetical protein